MVLTKTDRLSPSEATDTLARVATAAAAAFERALGEAASGSDEAEADGSAPEVLVTSSKSKPPLGRDRLWEYLWGVVVD